VSFFGSVVSKLLAEGDAVNFTIPAGAKAARGWLMVGNIFLGDELQLIYPI